MAHGTLQHALPGPDWSSFHFYRNPTGPPLYPRSCRCPVGRLSLAYPELWQHRLRLWHGHAAGFQWRRRYTYADVCEFLWLLGTRDPLGVVAFFPPGAS